MPISGQVSSYSVITYTMNSYQAATTSAPVATMNTQNVQNSNAVTYSNTNVSTISTTYGVQGSTQPPTASVVYTSSADNGIVIVKGAVEGASPDASAAYSMGSSTTPPIAMPEIFMDSGGADSVNFYTVTTPGVVEPEQSIITPEATINTKLASSPAIVAPDMLNSEGIKTPPPTNNSSSIEQVQTEETSGTTSASTSSPNDKFALVIACSIPNMEFLEWGSKIASKLIENNICKLDDFISNYQNLDLESEEAREFMHTSLDAAGMIPGAGAAPDILNASLYLEEEKYFLAGVSVGAILLDAVNVGKLAVKGISKLIDGLPEWLTKFFIKKTDDVIGIAKEAGEEIAETTGKELTEQAGKQLDDFAEEVVEGGADVLNNLKPQNLMDELASSGVKYNPDDVIAVTKTADGKLVWLENGTDTAGLNHIITEHADDFLNKGITQEQIPDYVMNALENGKIVGYQGRGTSRPIFEFTYNGEIHKVAITVGDNGFVVGANPK